MNAKSVQWPNLNKHNCYVSEAYTAEKWITCSEKYFINLCVRILTRLIQFAAMSTNPNLGWKGFQILFYYVPLSLLVLWVSYYSLFNWLVNSEALHRNRATNFLPLTFSIVALLTLTSLSLNSSHLLMKPFLIHVAHQPSRHLNFASQFLLRSICSPSTLIAAFPLVPDNPFWQ